LTQGRRAAFPDLVEPVQVAIVRRSERTCSHDPERACSTRTTVSRVIFTLNE
jgi:hypothetical protein